MCNIAYICCGADEADDTEFAYYNQAESMHQENYRFRLVLYTPAIGVAIGTEC